MLLTFKQIFVNDLNSPAFSQQHFWIVIKKLSLERHCSLTHNKFMYTVHKFLKYFTWLVNQP